jgi:hypothetical protein
MLLTIYEEMTAALCECKLSELSPRKRKFASELSECERVLKRIKT